MHQTFKFLMQFILTRHEKLFIHYAELILATPHFLLKNNAALSYANSN